MGFLSNRRLVILPTTRCALSVRLVHAEPAVSQPRRDPLLEQPLPITPAVSPPRLGGYFLVREMLQRSDGFTATPNRSCLSADGALPAHFTYCGLIEYEASPSRRHGARG